MRVTFAIMCRNLTITCFDGGRCNSWLCCELYVLYTLFLASNAADHTHACLSHPRPKKSKERKRRKKARNPPRWVTLDGFPHDAGVDTSGISPCVRCSSLRLWSIAAIPIMECLTNAIALLIVNASSSVATVLLISFAIL